MALPKLDKSNLRRQIIHKISSLSEKEKKAIEEKLYRQLFQSFLWKEANVIGMTSSTSIEWDTGPIIEKAWQEEKTVALPKTVPERKQLEFYRVDSFDELSDGYANILEPERNAGKFVHKNEIDLLIVPGIVFDCKGYRIGFGGGYYDRFLTDFSNRTVSIASKLQFVESIPHENHDIPIQYLIREDGLFQVCEV